MKPLENMKRLLAIYGIEKTLLFGFRYLQFFYHGRIRHRPTVLRKLPGFPMILSTTAPGVSKSLYIYGERELDMQLFLREALKPGDRSLVVGANIGHNVLTQAMIVGPRGFVFTVEPDPRNLPLLRENIRLNHLERRVSVEQCAIGERPGTLVFGMHHKSNLSRLIPDGASPPSGFVRLVPVPVRGVADVLTEIGGVELLTMDIEGAEVLVFKGMLSLPREQAELLPATIIFEVHAEEHREVYAEMPALLEAFCRRGYSVRAVTSSDETAEEPIRRLGYSPAVRLTSDSHRRSIFRDIAPEHAVKLVIAPGCVRTMVVARAPLRRGRDS